MTFSLALALSLNELYLTLVYGNYYYVDFGRWFGRRHKADGGVASAAVQRAELGACGDRRIAVGNVQCASTKRPGAA